MRCYANLRCRCFDHHRKQRNTILLNADKRYSVVVPSSNSATNLVAAELCLVRNVPFRFPTAVRRKSRIAFTDDAAPIAFGYVPVHARFEGNHQSAKDGNVTRESLHFHRLSGTIEIAVGDYFDVCSLWRWGVITA